jgi:hypothetical protein
MAEIHSEGAGRAPRDGEFAAVVMAMRAIGERRPAAIDGLATLRAAAGGPVRLTYVHEAGAIVLLARRSGHGEAVRCAELPVPEWLFAPGPDAGDPARVGLAELVRASFAVLEARLSEWLGAEVGVDTRLEARPGAPAALAIRPASTPSPALHAALPTPAEGYRPDGDPRQAGGARTNRGTGGTGVDGTHVPDAAASPREQGAERPLAGAPETLEGTLGEALVEGSPSDEDPPAASPGRLGH